MSGWSRSGWSKNSDKLFVNHKAIRPGDPSKERPLSLLSILNETSTGTSATATSAAATIKLALAKAQAAAASASASDGSSGASISGAALLAAAQKADNAKDFTLLSQEVRATLDTQYKAGRSAGKADLSALSGRAVAAIALNKTGAFSRAESAQAKSELAAREKQGLTDAVSSGMSIATLKSYGESLVSSYDAMSAEERQARGWTAHTRSSAASIAAAPDIASLFDMES